MRNVLPLDPLIVFAGSGVYNFGSLIETDLMIKFMMLYIALKYSAKKYMWV